MIRLSAKLLLFTQFEDTMRYWINTVSRNHVQAGIEGGFTQPTTERTRGSSDLRETTSSRFTHPGRSSEAVSRFKISQVSGVLWIKSRTRWK